MIDLETGEVITPFIRTPYNYNTNQVSDATGTDTGTDSKTQQQFAEEVDINTIVERFRVTGEMPPAVNFPQPQEFAETFDFQTAMNVIRQAQESFMELPAKARARFDNNPQKFMEFMNDAENQDEAIKLGLATRKPEEPTKEIVNAPKEPVKKEKE